MPYDEIVYWDSNVWISWLLNETWRPRNEFDGVIECVEKIRKGSIKVVTADIIYSEVANARMKDEDKKLWAALTKRRNIQFIPNNPRIGDICVELKRFYRQLHKQDKGGTLTDFDAQHLSTAIHLDVSAFYTFDDGQHGGRNLLSLNGRVGDHSLTVVKPPIGQYRLSL